MYHFAFTSIRGLNGYNDLLLQSGNEYLIILLFNTIVFLRLLETIMYKILIPLIFINFESFSKSFCIIENLKNFYNEKINCKNKDFVFGYLNFNSENKNLDYVEDKKKNIKVVRKYYKNINKFIDNLCFLDNYLKIKEITNFDKKKKMFKVVLIISCRIKNEK